MRIKQLLVVSFLTLLTAIPVSLLAQEVKVSGKVIDSKTEAPLVGATIRVKNSNASAVSNSSGEFTIKAPSSQSIITVTYVGYGVFETKAGSGNLDVKLDNINSDLNEVIVIGYGTQKKSHLTGAIEAIKGKDVEDLPVGNLGAALTGRLVGVNVSGGTSRPGSQATITVRNPVTLAKDGGNNFPLYIIDDIIQTTPQGLNDATLFNSLDPSEVESISILKDGAAAIYGSRAAAGAVIVRTKRGTAGKPRITYSGLYSVNDEAYRTKMMNAYELARYINIVNGPYGQNTTNPDLKKTFFSQDELDHFRTINYDWLDEAWSSAYNTRHTLGLSGGADKATYFANVSYYTQDGNIGRLDYGKWTYRAGIDATVAAGLKTGLQVAGNNTNSSKINSEVGGENVENDYRNLLKAPRYIPPYIDGLPVKLPGPAGNNIAAYHFFELNRLNNYIEAQQASLTFNAYLEYEVPWVKGLKARGSYARIKSNSRDERVGLIYPLNEFSLLGANQHIYDGATLLKTVNAQNDNRIRFANHNSLLTQSNFTLSYGRQFGAHNISALFSVERSETKQNQDEAWKENPSPFTNGQFNTAFGSIDGRTFAYEGGTLGYIGRVNYSFRNKYIGEFLFRSDASTKFAPENYWGKFYSLSAGWVISEEDFFKPRWVDFLKLRYSIGMLGKDDTRPWQWRQRYTLENGKGGVFGQDANPANIGIKMQVAPNRNATWSDELKQNLGIDARFLKNRLSATVELFYNMGRDLLLERTGAVPVTVGGSLASQNYGSIDFFGYELSVGWNSTIGRDFSYGIDTRFSWSDDRTSLINYTASLLAYPWTARPGRSQDIGKWGYDYLGMFRSQGEIDAYVSKYNITEVFGVKAADLKPGMLYYGDVRGALQADGTFSGPNGIIDDKDQVQLASKASNHYSFGATLKAGYKGINFECVVGGSFGGWSEIDARSTLQTDITALNANGPAYWADIYDPTLNPGGKYPNPWWDDVSLVPVSNFWKVNAFRMRIINASLSYSLPKRITNLAKISNARFIVSALNPLNLYNPFGYKDPDAGWDNYPVLRTISMGLNVTF